MPSLPSPAQPATITIAPLEVRSASLAEQAYASLRTLILDRKISAGSPLQEGRLAEELRVSRTPMREGLGRAPRGGGEEGRMSGPPRGGALVRLAGEGLLVRRDARSYAVRALGTKEYFDCMRAREIIEGEAIVLAVDKISDAQIDALEADLKSFDAGEHDETEHWHFDDRFHLIISTASGNVVLPRLVEELRVNARLFRLHSPLHRQRENHDEHGVIIRALRARDPVLARDAMRAHLRSLQEDVKRAIVD